MVYCLHGITSTKQRTTFMFLHFFRTSEHSSLLSTVPVPQVIAPSRFRLPVFARMASEARSVRAGKPEPRSGRFSLIHWAAASLPRNLSKYAEFVLVMRKGNL
jgi:hypothetical protein